MAAAPSIALFIDRPDWHSGQLAAAFARRDATAACLSLKDCGFAVAPGRNGLRLPGFEDRLPDAAFVRTIAAGSFEQVTMRLGVLHALQAAGVVVCNDARAIERCVDKSTTSFLLARAGVPTPPTWTVEGEAQARAVVRAEAAPCRPLVLKPLFGSQGRGLRLIADEGALPPADEVAGVYYLQRFVGSGAAPWRDWRVFVVGERAVAAMMRHGAHWRTNAAQGARCEAVPPDDEMTGPALAAARAVGARYAGVDLIRDADGRLLVLEVNSNPAWTALQQVSSVNLAQILADHLLSLLPAAAPAMTGVG